MIGRQVGFRNVVSEQAGPSVVETGTEYEVPIIIQNGIFQIRLEVDGAPRVRAQVGEQISFRCNAGHLSVRKKADVQAGLIGVELPRHPLFLEGDLTFAVERKGRRDHVLVFGRNRGGELPVRGKKEADAIIGRAAGKRNLIQVIQRKVRDRSGLGKGAVVHLDDGGPCSVGVEEYPSEGSPDRDMAAVVDPQVVHAEIGCTGGKRISREVERLDLPVVEKKNTTGRGTVQDGGAEDDLTQIIDVELAEAVEGASRRARRGIAGQDERSDGEVLGTEAPPDSGPKQQARNQAELRKRSEPYKTKGMTNLSRHRLTLPWFLIIKPSPPRDPAGPGRYSSRCRRPESPPQPGRLNS